MTNDELDPVEEIRAIRKKISRKFKTIDAYFDHLKTIPPADVLLARIRRKNRKETHMRVALNTLSKRQDAVLEALSRNEKISVSHAGKVVATLQPQGVTPEKKKRADIPFFGMWADRKDMDDPTAWRQEEWRKQRESREAGLRETERRPG